MPTYCPIMNFAETAQRVARPNFPGGVPTLSLGARIPPRYLPALATFEITATTASVEALFSRKDGHNVVTGVNVYAGDSRLARNLLRAWKIANGRAENKQRLRKPRWSFNEKVILSQAAALDEIDHCAAKIVASLYVPENAPPLGD
jgi:hypothetical protein